MIQSIGTITRKILRGLVLADRTRAYAILNTNTFPPIGPRRIVQEHTEAPRIAACSSSAVHDGTAGESAPTPGIAGAGATVALSGGGATVSAVESACEAAAGSNWETRSR